MHFDAGTISFPGLGIEGINPPRTLPFSIFGKEIYFYGLIIALGFLLAILYAKKRVKQFGTNFDLVTDAILFAVPLAIICARIYYVIFQWDNYKDNPISALYIWQGGIAIYGGVIGAILGLLLFAKVKKQKLTPYLDIMALGLLIGQLIGRWGNFFNREAFGGYTNNLLAMQLPVSAVRQNEITEEMWQHAVTINGVQYIQVHPTFLYEGLWNCGVLVILILMRKKTKSPGELFMLYIALYGLGRFWIESLRTDQLLIPGTAIPVSMVVSAVGVIGSVIFIIYGRKKVK